MNIQDHANLTSEQLREMMLEYLESSHCEFSEDMPATPENINWMLAVYMIQDDFVQSKEDLLNLLACMNKHYEGPTSVHEGWGGCEADSNQELITEKLKFDLGELFEMHNVQATLAAIELGWMSGEDYDDLLDGEAEDIIIRPDDDSEDPEYEADRIHIKRLGNGKCEMFVFGKTEGTRFSYREHTIVDIHNSFEELTTRLYAYNDPYSKTAYVRSWAARKGFPFQPYNQ